jgi:EpsD family peptidyl-prolyl cis-trans isomerase
MASFDKSAHRWARLLTASAAAACLGLTACGDKPVDATQVAARVNKGDITVHQINFLLQQDRSVRPEQSDAASRRLLEGLIDQELAVQKALELKLDREPRIVQAMESARRDVLARAYNERLVQGVAQPTPEDARKYYGEQPALFKERKVYSLQEMLIDAPPEKQPWVKQELSAAKSAKDFAESLKSAGVPFSGSQGIKGAEQLPLGLVERFAAMKDGESAVVSEGNQLRVIFVVASRSDPVSFERASGAIEQYLANQARRRAVDENIKALRSAAQINYQGRFAGGPGASASAATPASAPVLPAMSPVPVQVQLPETSPQPVQLSMPDAAPAPASSGSGISPDLAKKGLGLK